MKLMNTLYFQFEADFVEDDVRCIPMVVRFKLDACGIKLKLKEWSNMNVDERNRLAETPCQSSQEIKIYRTFVQDVVRNRCHQEATPLAIDHDPLWAQLNTVPKLLQDKIAEFNIHIPLDHWKGLNTLQRFALIKLCAGGHEHKNLLKALDEFQLAGEYVSA
jgi:hypothetical protein